MPPSDGWSWVAVMALILCVGIFGLVGTVCIIVSCLCILVLSGNGTYASAAGLALLFILWILHKIAEFRMITRLW